MYFILLKLISSEQNIELEKVSAGEDNIVLELEEGESFKVIN